MISSTNFDFAIDNYLNIEGFYETEKKFLIRKIYIYSVLIESTKIIKIRKKEVIEKNGTYQN